MTTPQIIEKMHSQAIENTAEVRKDLLLLMKYLGTDKTGNKTSKITEDICESTLSKPNYNFVSRTIDINCSYENCSEKLKFSQEQYNNIISKNHKPLCKKHLEIKKLIKKKNLAKKYNELQFKYNSAMELIDTLIKMVNNKTNIDEIKNILSNFKISSDKDFESFNKSIDEFIY